MEIEKLIEATCIMRREHYRLVWNIEGFNMMPFIRDHPLYGPSIRLGKEEDSTWQLLLSKERGEDDKLPSIGCKLVKTEDNTVWDVCRYDVTVKSKSGDVELIVVKNGLAGGEEDSAYTYVKGALEKVYKNEDGAEQPTEDSPFKVGKRDSLPKGDPESDKILQALFKVPVLVVECDIRYTYVTNNMEPTDESQEKLVVEDLGQLFKSQKFSDAILCAGNKEFRVHKSILCSRSAGFEGMFGEHKKEGITKFSLDVTESVAEMMLKFIYCGEVSEETSTDDYCNLYVAAKMYGIKSLENYCSLILKLKRCDPCHDAKILKLLESEMNGKTDVKKIV